MTIERINPVAFARVEVIAGALKGIELEIYHSDPDTVTGSTLDMEYKTTVSKEHVKWLCKYAMPDIYN
jgi:hypothetical protein